MSDSSNDGCKDMNKDSEVSSSCSDGRRAQTVEVECDATPAEEPKPRSLSPDTSDVAGSDELAGPSHQAPLFAAANSTGSREGEPLTSTTGHGRSVAVSSHQEAGVSSGQTSGCSQQEVSSADLVETKSSSSDEYFEADASPFEASVDVSGSQDPTVGQEVVESAAEPTPQPWEAEISSESDSENAAAISSGQSSNMRLANEATASATLRLPQKSWEMLMSYESSSEDGEAESSNQQLTDAVSGSHDNVGQISETREISTTQQPSASASPSNSQDIVDTEPEVVSGVSASVSSVRELEQERASSSELQLETSAVSGSQDRSEEQVEAGSSSIIQVSDELNPSNSQQFSPESDDLTSSGQPSTSQEVTESHRISEELSPSHQQLSSSHQVDVSPEDMEVDADLTSSGHVGSQSLVLDEGNSQEAEASSVSETENAQVVQPVAGPSSQTVSASDDMGSSSQPLSSSSPQIAERPSESGQAQQVPGDVSGSSDSPEDEGMSSSTLQASPRPDSPSTQRAVDRPVSAAQVVSRVNVMAGGSQSCEGDVEMSSSSGALPASQSREVDGAASQSREVGGPASQSREVDGAVFQSREVDIATSQSREVEGAASQSREVEGAASQSREVEGAASQSREVEGAASQSREVEGAASQSREIEGAASQSREVNGAASQSREVNGAASQSREVDAAGPSVAESSVRVPISQPPMPSVSSATRERPTESSDEEPGSASAPQSMPQQSRPQDLTRMSVLAQQLRVTSATGRQANMLRQLISSLNETGPSSRHGSVGPDSTTMDQSNADAGEEVSTTEEEQPGQVSTSQQRVVSTSWPPHAPSRVSSSADSSGGGHISTSAQLGGLLASRLSRDPQVSTSANAASFPRDHDMRDGGASSTTSGLRGLLSSAPRPIGVSSSSRPQLGFSPPSQSCEPSPRLANAEIVVLSTPQHSTRPSRNTPSNAAQACSSSHEQRLSLLSKPGSSKMLATAPGDQFPNDPDKRSKKRKKSSDKEDPLPPAKHSQPGPSRPAPQADLGTSASLVEQLRKAGVIITPVPSAPSHPQQAHQSSSSSMSRPKATMRMKDIAESAVSSPPTSVSISRVTEQIDSSSSDDIQMLEMFGKPNSTPQQSDTGTTGPSPEESVGEEDGQFVLAGELETQSQSIDDGTDPNKRKRKPRKPKEINPEMLRPKRPRKAKEKPESEEDTKEKPKRGRKKKEKVEPPQEESKSSEVSAEPEPEPEVVAVEVVPEVVPSPEKPKAKERAKKSNSKVVGEPPARPQDEDTRMSTMSTEDSQQSRPDVAFRKSVLPVLDVHAETLVEYQWPLNDRLAESYMIQEQVIQYLGIKSFKRKYPDLKRRPVEPEEREFLQERGLVAEALCDLGLTAVPSAEVLDVMSADFQEKYEEYRRALRDKQAREVSGKQKAAAAAGGERGRQVDQKMRAMQSAAKWNASLNRERREERRCCCDLQTMSVQFPQTRVKAMTKEVPKLGTYPVSLIPGQFTDFYKRYTPAELRYLPLNTVLYGPMLPNEEMEEKASEGSPSDSEDSSSSDETSSSSSSDGTQDTEETGSTAAEPEQDIPSASAASGPPAGSKCKVCSLIGNHPDSMVVCAQCNSAGHLNCFGLSTDMLPHIRRYAWQCTDCKTCIQCKDPADEDKMLFCDMCDRGYHIYCVGLRKVPDGRWHCQECAVCGSCGSLDPAGVEAASVASPPASPDKIQPQWQHEFKRGEKGARVYAQTLCVPCSRLWRRGSFCQLCLRCFRKPDASTMLSCSVCDKWMHAECCSLAPGVDAPKMGGSSFVCEVCQEASHVRSAPTTPARIVKVATRV